MAVLAAVIRIAAVGSLRQSVPGGPRPLACLRTTGFVDEPTRAEIFDRPHLVIAWEIDAQVGVQRAVEAMASLIADAVLDRFQASPRLEVDPEAVRLAPVGATAPGAHGWACSCRA